MGRIGAIATCGLIEAMSARPSTGAKCARLSDGRWHFQHRPIDLIIAAHGNVNAVKEAAERAWQRFEGVLGELVAELRVLRAPVSRTTALHGPIAQRMHAACWPHRAQFITPMAAVAGAVADEMIGFFRDDPHILRAYVNNGGDIALYLSTRQDFKIGLFADLGRVKRREQLSLDGDFSVKAETPVRGVATSGWRGRSFSLGIADSVTVLACTAAEADAAATMIANSVNVDDPAILRTRASELKDDTDLGDRLVTVEVGALSHAKVEQALDAGQAHARQLLAAGTIYGAVICLQGRVRVVGDEFVIDQMSAYVEA